MALKVAICDDSIRDAQFASAILSGWAARRQAEAHIEVFSSAEGLKNILMPCQRRHQHLGTQFFSVKMFA